MGEVTCRGSPNLSCTRSQIKMRDNMDRGGYLTYLGSPSPCKEALRLLIILLIRHALRFTNIKRVN